MTHTAGRLSSLVSDPATLGKLTKRITAELAKSFTTNPVAHKTDAEVKRRFEICTKWFLVLRFEKKASIPRSLDEMSRALLCELNKQPYEPRTERALWTPGQQ